MNTLPSKKRDRNANFSLKETKMLVSLIESRINIIENKKSNAQAWQEKEKAWKAIEVEFNTAGVPVHRDAKHLKVKYESLKRDVRKKIIAQDTPDNNSKNLMHRLTPIDLKIHEFMSMSAKEDNSDSDSDRFNNQNSNDLVQIEMVDVEESHSPKLTCVDEETLTPGISLGDTKTNQKVWNEWKPIYKFEERNTTDSNCAIEERKHVLDDASEKKDLISLKKKLIGEEIQERVLRKILIREEIEHKREMYKLEKEEMLLKLELLKNRLQNTAQE